MSSIKLKIAIVVHGRFRAFDFTCELLRQGHDVTLFTNYPKFIVKRFGVPNANVRNFLVQGILSRLIQYSCLNKLSVHAESWLHLLFGRWAAHKIVKEKWDVIVCWNGVGEETFRALEGSGVLRICYCGSAHIRTHARIIKEEEKRVKVPLEQPSIWGIVRKEREYALADIIWVPSTFAKRTFSAQGVLPEKVYVIPQGADTKTFRPDLNVIESRCNRIISKKQLNVLNVGTFSFRKGIWDMADIIERLDGENFNFRFVGSILPETLSLASRLRNRLSFIPKQPQHKLPSHYEWGDIFVFPTIQDGFAAVLAQASAACLPILTTSNSAASDLVVEDKTGWVLPIRDPQAFAERLRWCDSHRRELAQMVRYSYETFKLRSWAEVAKDFIAICLRLEHSTNKRVPRI